MIVKRKRNDIEWNSLFGYKAASKLVCRIDGAGVNKIDRWRQNRSACDRYSQCPRVNRIGWSNGALRRKQTARVLRFEQNLALRSIDKGIYRPQCSTKRTKGHLLSNFQVATISLSHISISISIPISSSLSIERNFHVNTNGLSRAQHPLFRSGASFNTKPIRGRIISHEDIRQREAKNPFKYER